MHEKLTSGNICQKWENAGHNLLLRWRSAVSSGFQCVYFHIYQADTGNKKLFLTGKMKVEIIKCCCGHCGSGGTAGSFNPQLPVHMLHPARAEPWTASSSCLILCDDVGVNGWMGHIVKALSTTKVKKYHKCRVLWFRDKKVSSNQSRLSMM